jgi:cytochrome c biogenesis protein
MATALWLLLALAIATVIATFIPQEPVIPPTVAEWRAGTMGPGEGVAAAFDALGLFDVFGAPWFMALTVLLLVSLTGCLVPRVRGFAKVVRRPPSAGRNLARLCRLRRLWLSPAADCAASGFASSPPSSPPRERLSSPRSGGSGGRGAASRSTSPSTCCCSAR